MGRNSGGGSSRNTGTRTRLTPQQRYQAASRRADRFYARGQQMRQQAARLRGEASQINRRTKTGREEYNNLISRANSLESRADDLAMRGFRQVRTAGERLRG